MLEGKVQDNEKTVSGDELPQEICSENTKKIDSNSKYNCVNNAKKDFMFKNSKNIPRNRIEASEMLNSNSSFTSSSSSSSSLNSTANSNTNSKYRNLINRDIESNTQNENYNSNNSHNLTDTTNDSLYNEAMHDLGTRVTRVDSFIPEICPTLSKNVSNVVLPPFGKNKDYPSFIDDMECYQVDFYSEDDPLHPFNWKFHKKLINALIMSITTFCVAFSSSVGGSAIPYIMKEFHVGEVVATFNISLYIFGFAAGPSVWGPISEIYGRRLPFVISQFGFVCFQFGAATAKDFQTLCLTRFFAGACGCCLLAVVSAAFSDMFPTKSRGYSIAMFALCVFMGPMWAPSIGGFISKSYLGWRWCFYIAAIFSSLTFVLNLFFFNETYAAIILKNKAKHLRDLTGNWAIHAPIETASLDFKTLVEHNFARPCRMILTEPLLLLISLYNSFVYGILYLFIEAYPIIFGTGGYGWSPGVNSLPYTGLVVGEMIGVVIVCSFERDYQKGMILNNNVPIPELRLLPMFAGAFLFPAGIFWLCWTGAYPNSVHWLAPTFSGIFTGSGLLCIFLPSINYIIDSYLVVAASAMSANTILRSSFGAAFPLFGNIMFHNLGTQWAGTLIGCIAALLSPVPIFFWIFGARIRMNSSYNPAKMIKKKQEEDEIRKEIIAKRKQKAEMTFRLNGKHQ